MLFVSHNIGAVLRLCNSAILLNDGAIQSSGAINKVVNLYLKSDLGISSSRRWDETRIAPGNAIVRLIEVRVHTEENDVCENFDVRKRIGITMDYEVLQEGHIFTHGCNLFNEQGINILNSHDVVSDLRTVPRSKGCYSSTMWIPGNFLSEGPVTVGVAIFKLDPFAIHFHELDVVAFNVVDEIHGDSARGNYVGGFPGVVRPLLDWRTVKK